MPKRLRRSCRALVKNYLYQGKKIDQQVHLFILATISFAPNKPTW